MLPKVQVSDNSNTHIHVWLLSCNKCIIINIVMLVHFDNSLQGHGRVARHSILNDASKIAELVIAPRDAHSSPGSCRID